MSKQNIWIVALLRLVRWPNLVIVVLTQFLLYYIAIYQELRFPLADFVLLVVWTVLITAGGYIVNDIEDVEIDRLNKAPEKQIVGKVFSRQAAWQIYGLVVTSGFGISLYLTVFSGHGEFLLIYPVLVWLLWAYSKWLKKSVLWGNLLISFLCTLAAWVVLYAQILYSGWPQNPQTVLTFAGYGLFAFFSTLFREIIKDIEDQQGDAALGCRTLAVVYGQETAKRVAFIVGCMYLFIIGIANFYVADLPGTIYKILVFDALVLLPQVYALYFLVKAKTKTDFGRLSHLSKLFMVSGLLFLLVLV